MNFGWAPNTALCCACRARRFQLVKKYEVEFNKAALSLAEGMTNPQQKKAALNRLLKVRVGAGCPAWQCLPAVMVDGAWRGTVAHRCA